MWQDKIASVCCNILMEEICAQLVPADETETVLSLFEEAKRKINSALRELREKNTLLQRSPCLIFEGCQLHLMSDTTVGPVYPVRPHISGSSCPFGDLKLCL